MTPQPVACTLTPEQQRCNSAELLPGLSKMSSTQVWTPTGIRFSFRPESTALQTIAHVIDRERVCCAFLTFRLEVPDGGRDFQLELTGPPGTREFLAGLELTSFPPPEERLASLGE